ncbi:MAG: hypothetical protein AB8C84_09935 [Oligoflexales bacterium]
MRINTWILFASILFAVSCKNKKKQESPPLLQGKSGQIYFTDHENAIAKTPDGQISFGEGTTDSSWIEDDLTWIVLDASKYPELAKKSGSSTEITLAVKSSAITVKKPTSLSLAGKNSSSTRTDSKTNKKFNEARDLLASKLIFSSRQNNDSSSKTQNNNNLKNDSLSQPKDITRVSASPNQNISINNSNDQNTAPRKTMNDVLQQISQKNGGIAGQNSNQTNDAQVLLTAPVIPDPATPGAKVTFQTVNNNGVEFTNNANTINIRENNTPIETRVRSYRMAGAIPVARNLSPGAQTTRNRNHIVADQSIKNYFSSSLKSLNTSENKRKTKKALLAVAGFAGLAGLGYGLYYAFFTGEEDKIIAQTPPSTPDSNLNPKPEDPSYEPLKPGDSRNQGTATPVDDPTGNSTVNDSSDNVAAGSNTNTDTTTTTNTDTTTTDTVDTQGTPATGVPTGTTDPTPQITLPEAPTVPAIESVIIDFSVGVKVYLANRVNNSDAGFIDLSQSVELEGEIEVLSTGLNLDCKNVCVYLTK